MMSFWEILTISGLVATIMGAFLTLYALINNKTLKEESRLTREMLDRIERGQENLQRGMTEAIKYLADLIVREGERTREAIKTP
jgi:hypothetical protein